MNMKQFFIVAMFLITLNAVAENDQLSNESSNDLYDTIFLSYDDLNKSAFEKEYDSICDEIPIRKVPVWRVWFNKYGSALVANCINFKKYVEKKYAIAKYKLYSLMKRRRLRI